MAKGELTPIMLCVLLPPVTSLWAPIVTTTSGQVSGQYNIWFNVGAYRGVPYGKADRFGDPNFADPWSGVRDCSENGPMCAQPECSGLAADFVCSKTVSEDCLVLNVYVPLWSGSSLPVVVWFHGGNFETGTASSLIFDGSHFASVGKAVFVAVNYRLSALGFLGIFNESAGTLEGNWGLKDMVLALRWVQRNIAAFRGDPNQVTVMGQSAGAVSISALLTSDPSNPEVLFHKAILHSTPGCNLWRNYQQMKKQAEAFAQYVGCPFNDLDCLRSVNFDLVQRAQSSGEVRGVNRDSPNLYLQPWGPSVDGTLIKMQLVDALRTGHFRPVPIMAGSTQHDGVLYARMFSDEAMTSDEYKELTIWLLQNNTEAHEAMLELYPPEEEPFYAFARGMTDYVFACPARLLARSMVAAGQPAWLWVFDQPVSFPFQDVLGDVCSSRACHGGDVPFIFNSLLLAGFPTALVTGDNDVSRNIATRWGGFASERTDPNSFLLFPTWRRWQEASPSPSLHIRALFSSAESDYHRHSCDVIDSFGCVVA